MDHLLTPPDIRQILVPLFVLIAILCGVAFLPEKLKGPGAAHTQHYKFTSSHELVSFLDKHTCTPKCPLQINVRDLPKDFDSLEQDERTRSFIALLIPLIDKRNCRILRARKRLILFILKEKSGRKIQKSEQEWIRDLARQYGEPDATAEELLTYVDIIPASLALAQAITESGWGTSRFARQGNALFGEHLTADSTANHIKARNSNTKVAAFETLEDSVISYIDNLNTSAAYTSLRNIRKTLRKQQLPLTGSVLCRGLLRYSEKKAAYIEILQNIMDHYDLKQYDRFPCKRSPPEIRVSFH